MGIPEGDDWLMVFCFGLLLIMLWAVLISFFSRMLRKWRIHRWFTHRFHQPPLQIGVGDKVVTTFGFTGEVVSVTDQFAELRVGSGERKAVIMVFRGEIVDQVTPM
jgi:preprotein translocase subunit YajC